MSVFYFSSKKAEEPTFGHYRGEIVRKKEDREKLPGWECHDCQKVKTH
jgi:hypothetical protein